MSVPAIYSLTNNPLPEYRNTRLPEIEIYLGSPEDIPPGEGRAYRIGGESIAVFRQRSGKLFAIQNECPHRGGPLSEGIMGEGAVLCPLHAWRFDLKTGGCQNDPCTLRTYSVRVEDGRLYLRMP